MIEAPVRDHMQRDPLIVSPSLPIGALADLFAARGVGFAPVVEGDRVVGVVTETELVLQEVGADELHPPHAIPFLGDLVFWEGSKHFEDRIRRAVGATVADLMIHDPVTVRVDATVHEAARLIVEHDVPRVPVLDAQGGLVGTIGRAEIVRALASEL